MNKYQMRIGFSQCQQNAYESILLSIKLFNEKNYRPSIFFGLLAIEETGKGYFLFDSHNTIDQLTAKDLGKGKLFFNHLEKMQIARKEHEEQVRIDLTEGFPWLGKALILGYSQKDFDDMWRLRNDILFVDYDFKIRKWKHPQQITYDEKLAYGVLEKAQAIFKSFEFLLFKFGHDTFLKFS
jgi:AbiV family abortive infection protein